MQHLTLTITLLLLIPVSVFAAPVTQTDDGIPVTLTGGVNMRPDASTEGSPVGTLPGGEVVVLTFASGQVINGNDIWWQVRLPDGTTGWVAEAVLSIAPDEAQQIRTDVADYVVGQIAPELPRTIANAVTEPDSSVIPVEQIDAEIFIAEDAHHPEIAARISALFVQRIANYRVALNLADDAVVTVVHNPDGAGYTFIFLGQTPEGAQQVSVPVNADSQAPYNFALAQPGDELATFTLPSSILIPGIAFGPQQESFLVLTLPNGTPLAYLAASHGAAQFVPHPDAPPGVTAETLAQFLAGDADLDVFLTPQQQATKAAYDELVRDADFFEFYAAELAAGIIYYSPSMELYHDRQRDLYFIPQAGVTRGRDNFATSHREHGWGRLGMYSEIRDQETGATDLRIVFFVSDVHPDIYNTRYGVDNEAVKEVIAAFFLAEFPELAGQTINFHMITDLTNLEIGGPIVSRKDQFVIGGIVNYGNTIISPASVGLPDYLRQPGGSAQAMYENIFALYKIIHLKLRGTIASSNHIQGLNLTERILVPIMEMGGQSTNWNSINWNNPDELPFYAILKPED